MAFIEPWIIKQKEKAVKEKEKAVKEKEKEQARVDKLLRIKEKN